MSDPSSKSHLDTFAKYFDCITLSPDDWPVTVTAAIADERTMARWPAFPTAATLEQSRLGHGRGLDIASALRAALGEMIEIASCCDWGDLEIEIEALKEVGQGGWAPDALDGFSSLQYDARDSWNSRLRGLDWIPRRTDADAKIEWMAAELAFTRQTIMVPADFVVIGKREVGDSAAVSVADTNGCAAGSTPEAARLSALYELIERDATGRWWYGQRKCPRLSVNDSALANSIAADLFERGRELHIVNISSDLGLYTVAAIGAASDGSELTAGFGTRRSLQSALGCALSELMQMELKIHVSREAGISESDLDENDKINVSDLPLDGRLVATDLESNFDVNTGLSKEAELDACLTTLNAAGCKLAFLDFTRPEFGVPVFRAISPDMCHWKPRLGKPRLLAGDPFEPLPRLMWF